MILIDITKILAIIFASYIFYKGIKEKNKIKIVLPLIILLIVAIIKMRMIPDIVGFLLIFFLFFTVSCLPYVIGIIVSIIIIFIIRRKVAVQDRIAVCISAIIITMYISTLFEPVWFKYVSARPDDTYIKIKKINDNEKLIGLSKEEVITQLGQPESIGYNDSLYIYDAGEETSYVGFGGHTYYKLYIEFDENSKVKSTLIDIYEPPGG